MFKILAVLGVSLPLALAQSGTVTVRRTADSRSNHSGHHRRTGLHHGYGENGAFEFQNMMPGTWNVEADMFGFEPYKKDVDNRHDARQDRYRPFNCKRVQVARRREARLGAGAEVAAENQPQGPELIAEVPPEAPPQIPDRAIRTIPSPSPAR